MTRARESRESRETRLRATLEDQQKRQSVYRKTLLTTQDSLCFDAYFKPEFLPFRDELLRRLEQTLFPDGRQSSVPPDAVLRAFENAPGANR